MNKPTVRFDQFSEDQQAQILVLDTMNKPTVCFDQLSKDQQARILVLNQQLKEIEDDEKRVAQEAAHQMDFIGTNGQGDFLEGKLTIEFPITFEEYQTGAKKTAIYNQDARVLYPALGLAGEVGEIIEKVLAMAAHAGKCANQVKKIIRDDDCECDTIRKYAIAKEIGGCLWYCAAVASDLGLNLGDIAQENLDILASRQKRGTIKGDGDNR